MTKTVCIVGAGASGLAAIHTCLQYGFQPVCYEQSNDIGGLWRFREQVRIGEACVNPTTVINTSKELTAFSDHPPDQAVANYMRHEQVLEYLKSYADQFGLIKYIRFNQSIIDITQSVGQKSEENQWTVASHYIKDVESESNAMYESFDAVMVCSGHHHTPYNPYLPTENRFKGRVLHSHEFRALQDFVGMNVLIVGIGNSALDSAVLLSHVAKQVFLSTRRGAWVFPKTGLNGLPNDLYHTTRFARATMKWFPNAIQKSVVRLLNERFDHGLFGLEPAFGPFESHGTGSDELASRIVNGLLIRVRLTKIRFCTVKVKPGVRRLLEDSVMFDDGSAANVDVILKCTGFDIKFPFLQNGEMIKAHENWVDLYKNVYLPNLKHSETFGIIGLVQPNGSTLPVSEMQCRLFCEVLSKKIQLPSKSVMVNDIAIENEIRLKKFYSSRRHTIQIDYGSYMDDIAQMIGCYPSPVRYLLTDPQLAFALIWGPQVAYQYRLRGPKPWPEARMAILGVWDRSLAAFPGKKLKYKKKKSGYLPIFMSILVIGGGVYYFQRFLS